jgi:hypothetical protein
MSKVPEGAAEQLQWLVDRALLHDLMVEYARCVDDRDWEGWAALFTPDARFSEPFGSVDQSRLAEFASRALESYPMTHHMQGNLAIEIDGDTAKMRRYLQSYHMPDPEDLTRHADVGGWFDIIARRTGDGWKFQQVIARFSWLSGEEFLPPPSMPLDPPLD